VTRSVSYGAALLTLALLTASVTVDAAIPRNDGWVTDRAGFLTAQQEQSLETLMESYKSGSGHEVALLTVPDLGGQALARYALAVAREWGIGRADLHDGALLLVVRDERKIRIEVGRGLEGTLTDSISGRIIRDVIAPEFRQGCTYEGLRAGVEAIHSAAGGDYSQIPEQRTKSRRGSMSSLLFLIYIIIFIIAVVRRNRRGGGGSGGILPWLLLGSMTFGKSRGWHGGSSGGGSFGGFGGGGGFSGGGASGGW